MTFATAKAKLPKFAKGIAADVTTVGQLRDKVRQELTTYFRGSNPLSEKQAAALTKWLGKV